MCAGHGAGAGVAGGAGVAQCWSTEPHLLSALEQRSLAALRLAAAVQVNAHAVSIGKPAKSRDEVAAGFVVVANEAMARPIRALTQMKVSRAPSTWTSCGRRPGTSRVAMRGSKGWVWCALCVAAGLRRVCARADVLWRGRRAARLRHRRLAGHEDHLHPPVRVRRRTCFALLPSSAVPALQGRCEMVPPGLRAGPSSTEVQSMA